MKSIKNKQRRSSLHREEIWMKSLFSAASVLWLKSQLRRDEVSFFCRRDHLCAVYLWLLYLCRISSLCRDHFCALLFSTAADLWMCRDQRCECRTRNKQNNTFDLQFITQTKNCSAQQRMLTSSKLRKKNKCLSFMYSFHFYLPHFVFNWTFSHCNTLPIK